MEHSEPAVGQSNHTLTQLQSMIRRQRQAFRNGHSNPELAAQLQTWETMLAQAQQEIGLFSAASQTLNASLDWRNTIQVVMDSVIHITGAERGMLLLANGGDADGNSLLPGSNFRVEFSSVANGDPFSENDLKFSQSVVEQTLARGEPMLISNAQLDPRFQASDSVIVYGLRSILCVPLIHRGAALGVIYLDNRARSGAFTQTDLATLRAFAGQAAGAMSNALAHQKTDQALSEKIRELTVLQEMSRDLNASLNFERVMDRSIVWATVAANAESGALGLVAEEGLRWISQVGSPQPNTAEAMACIYHLKPIFEEKRMILPLLRDKRPIGVLYLVARERTFTRHKLEFVVRVADGAAIAVENARLYEALRKANTAKSEFVTLVSHELGAPMTSLRGYAEMLSNESVGPLTQQQREFTEAIRRNLNRMRVLVSDLLDISRIESGRLQLNLQALDLKPCLEEARQVVAEMLHEKQQILAVDVWPGLPRVYADPDRVVQILINLLSNAIKYTPDKGSIVVRAWLPADEPNFIRCAIVDSGVGIRAEDKAKIFGKFFRADDPQVREQQGTGLGLAITKNLVELQGGRIWVESELHQGSSFFFTLPLAIPEAGGLFLG